MNPDEPSPVSRPLTRTNGCVLFAVSDAQQPTESVREALALCRRLGVELNFVRVFRTAHGENLFSPRIDVAEAVRLVRRTLDALRTTRAWLSDALGQRVPHSRIQVRHGDFVPEVAAQASEVRAELIVISPLEWAGATATSLARASYLPVLVPRHERPPSLIVAASDLEDAEYPVLRRGAQVGELLAARLVAVHNVSPVSGIGGIWPLAIRLSSGLTSARLRRLERASAQLGIGAEAVVASEVRPADAILRVAEERRADMVVVGTRPRSWFDRLATASVAEEVVDRAAQSVLVTPIDAGRFVQPPTPEGP